MSKQNEEHVELSSSSYERLDLLYKNLNFISKAYYSSEGIFPFWESVYALIVGQLIIAYFNVNNDSGKILILVAGLIFSFCWARIVSLSYQYSKYRVKRMERLEDEIENIYGDFKLSFYKGSPKKDQKKGKLHSTWFYRRILPILLIVFWIFLAIIFSLLPILAAAAPDEASGIVTNVVDGDTFDLRIDKTDPRIIYEIDRVRLADVDSPEMSTPEGEPAKVFATEALLGKKVWLDIDDKSKDGRDPYGRLIAVVYLEDPDGSINTTHPFNRLLVDAGHAVVKDFTNNEFDPAAWWEEGIPQPELSPVPDTATTAKGGQFVGSVKSDKYHYPSCRWAEKILPENEIWFSSSEEARAAGYVPCGACKPP